MKRKALMVKKGVYDYGGFICTAITSSRWFTLYRYTQGHSNEDLRVVKHSFKALKEWVNQNADLEGVKQIVPQYYEAVPFTSSGMSHTETEQSVEIGVAELSDRKVGYEFHEDKAPEVSSKETDQSLTIPSNGIACLNVWLKAEDGQEYSRFYCNHWQIFTDSQMPIEKFHSSEKWTLIGFDKNKEVKLIVPGCKLDGLTVCKLESTVISIPGVYIIR